MIPVLPYRNSYCYELNRQGLARIFKQLKQLIFTTQSVFEGIHADGMNSQLEQINANLSLSINECSRKQVTVRCHFLFESGQHVNVICLNRIRRIVPLSFRCPCNCWQCNGPNDVHQLSSPADANQLTSGMPRLYWPWNGLCWISLYCRILHCEQVI